VNIQPDSRAQSIVTAWVAPEAVANLPNSMSFEELQIQFNKQYASIRPDERLSFADRMKFDIYKRETKDQRLEALFELRKVKKPQQDIHNMLQRFQKDLYRRRLAKESAELLKSEDYNDVLKKTKKKLTPKECENIYSRMKQKYEESQRIIEKKREIYRQMKEQQENAELGYAKKRKKTGEDLEKMIERFTKEKEQIERKIEHQRIEQELKEEEEYRKMFKPRLNSKRNSNVSSKLSSLFNSKDSLQKNEKNSSKSPDKSKRKQKLVYNFQEDYDEVPPEPQKNEILQPGNYATKPILKKDSPRYDEKYKQDFKNKIGDQLHRYIEEALSEEIIDLDIDEKESIPKQKQQNIRPQTSRIKSPEKSAKSPVMREYEKFAQKSSSKYFFNIKQKNIRKCKINKNVMSKKVIAKFMPE